MLALVGSCCLLVAPLVAAPPEEDTSRRPRVEALLEQSGLTAYAGRLDRFYEPELGQWKLGLSRSRFRVLRNAVDNGMDRERSHALLVGHFVAHTRPRALLAAMAFFESPLGRRVGEAERHVASPDGLDGLAAFAETLRSVPPAIRKQQMASRLDIAIGTSVERLAIHLAANRSLFLAALPLVPEDRRKTTEEADELLRIHTEKIADRVRALSTTKLLYMHQRMTTVQLSKYAAFAESRAGRWFYETRRGAIREVMTHNERAITAGVQERMAAFR